MFYIHFEINTLLFRKMKGKLSYAKMVNLQVAYVKKMLNYSDLMRMLTVDSL